MPCKICEKRRPRRFCPGVGGQICAVCCGTGREETVSCPLECEYLREARAHEKPPELVAAQIPNLDIEVSDSFLHRNEPLVSFLMHTLASAALSTPGVVDYDVREALGALVRTWRTRDSGLIYETKPSNLLAAGLQARLQEALEEFRRTAAERMGITTIRDADVLGSLAFLERVEYQMNNGRKRGRAFLDFLRVQMPSLDMAARPPAQSPLLAP
jgi:hypothetical protein